MYYLKVFYSYYDFVFSFGVLHHNKDPRKSFSKIASQVKRGGKLHIMVYDKKFDLLIDLNIEIIEYVKKQLDIKTKILFSSELDVSGNGSKKVLNICKSLNATNYISGRFWAKDNLNISDFTSPEFNFPIHIVNPAIKISGVAQFDIIFIHSIVFLLE